MAAAAPQGVQQFSNNNGNHASEPTCLSAPSSAHVAPDHCLGPTGHQLHGDSGTWQAQAQQQYPAPAPSEGTTPAPALPPPSSGGPVMMAAVSSDSIPPRDGEGEGAPGGSFTAGGMAAQSPPVQHQHQLYQVPPSAMYTQRLESGTAAGGTEGGAVGTRPPLWDLTEDEDERDLRIALEEESRFYGNEVTAGTAAASCVNEPFSTPTTVANAGSSFLGAAAAASAAPEVAGVGGAVASNASASSQQQQQQQQHDELAWVLEQSRLEAELHKSRRTMEEEGEEAMMARVLEESRREQETRTAELQEFERVSAVIPQVLSLASLLDTGFGLQARS